MAAISFLWISAFTALFIGDLFKPSKSSSIPPCANVSYDYGRSGSYISDIDYSNCATSNNDVNSTDSYNSIEEQEPPLTEEPTYTPPPPYSPQPKEKENLYEEYQEKWRQQRIDNYLNELERRKYEPNYNSVYP